MSDLRTRLLSNKKFRSRLVDVEIPHDDGTVEKLTVKVKQPSVDERNAIFGEAKISRDGGTIGGTNRVGALAIIHCVRHPDTDEPIFSVADVDALVNMPANGWVDTLAAKVMEVLTEAQELAKK